MAAAMVADLAAVVGPYLQQEKTFTEACRQANALQSAALEQAHRQYREQCQLEAALHQRRLALARELYMREMVHSIEVARRESERDVWSQKNQLIQTLMVIDTVMFSCAFSLAVEATATETTNASVLRLYSASTSIALGLLFISVWIAVKLQMRMASFDMHRPRQIYLCGNTHREFADFFACHCKRFEFLAFATFWCGTCSTVVAGAFYMATVFSWSMPRLLSPTIMFVALCALAFKAPVVLNPLLRSTG